MYFRLIPFFLLFLCLSGCEKITMLITPKKKPIASHTPLAQQAEKNFWDILHRGEYDKIPEATRLLTAAYLENPNDPKLAAHLGFIHIWKITERAREKTLDPTIVNEIILSRKYFADAVELAPRDARYQGFYGDSLLVEGKIFKDERQQVRGYFQLKYAIHMWPEFNYFSAGFPMSALDPNSKSFKEAVSWQWKTLDLCSGTSIDRKNPDYRPYMTLETQQGPRRACWNSWIAPHNFEGFFLNMGDMLVKQGDWQTAIKIYNNAKLSKDYPTWPFKNLLENRIQHARENVTLFQKSTTPMTASSNILFNSGFGCVVCHQRN